MNSALPLDHIDRLRNRQTAPAPAEQRTFMDDVALTGEIATLASEMTAKPRALPPDEWLEQCAFLEDRLAAALAATGYRHVFGDYESMLLQAIRLKLRALRNGDDYNAERAGRLVGLLIEDVRADGRALLAAAKG